MRFHSLTVLELKVLDGEVDDGWVFLHVEVVLREARQVEYQVPARGGVGTRRKKVNKTYLVYPGTRYGVYNRQTQFFNLVGLYSWRIRIQRKILFFLINVLMP